MPPHSSHILQPLDVGCFGLLKAAYGRQIEKMMKGGITHITKEDFFQAFHAAFQVAITKENIQGGFKGSGLMPYNPETVLSKLSVKLKTPTPPSTPHGEPQPWTSKTPTNATEAESQHKMLRDRISHHQGSSPTSIIDGLDTLVKGTAIVMHQMALLKAEVKDLQAANDILSRRRHKKKTHIQQGGSLTLREGQDQKAQIDADVQIKQET
jgi:hypothetical protein